VNAPADRVRALYRDPANWAHLFPATIRGARVVRKEVDTTVVEIDDVDGTALNILRDISSTRTDLIELKPRYETTFVNEFIPDGEGMRCTLSVGSMEVAVLRRREVCKAVRARQDAPICRGATQSSSGKNVRLP